MRRKTLIHQWWLVIVLGIGLANCNDVAIVPPAEKTGFVTGYTLLLDEYGQRVNDRSGVMARIVNRNITALTDTNGWYVLSNVPAGVFKIELSKEGYFPAKPLPFQFVGDDTLELDYNNITLTGIPGQRTITLSEPQLSEQSGKKVRFKASVDLQGKPTNFLLTISRDSGAMFNDELTWSIKLRPNGLIEDTMMLEYPVSDFKENAEMQSGERVYLIAWTTNSSGMTNGLHSNEISFVLP